MGDPAAKGNDRVVGVDVHMLVLESGAVTTAPLMFAGPIDGGLSSVVFVEEQQAATVDSTATNQPPHIPPTGQFMIPPSNRATIVRGSTTVFIDDKQAARNGDPARTCNDPTDLDVGSVIAESSVFVG